MSANHRSVPRVSYDVDQCIAEQELYTEGVIDEGLDEPGEPTFEFGWMREAYIAGRRDTPTGCAI